MNTICSTENVEWTAVAAKLDGYKFVTLTAAPGKQEFYRKLGWLRQSSAMIWPVSDQQREMHAHWTAEYAGFRYEEFVCTIRNLKLAAA